MSVTAGLAVLLIAVTLYGAHGQIDASASLDVPCTSHDDCVAYPHSQCLPLLNNSHTCACPAELGFHVDGQRCVHHANLGEVCNSTRSRCVTPRTTCRLDGFLNGLTRCLCAPGTISVLVNGTYMCGEVLVRQPECKPCEDNTGTCFDITGDQKQDGCSCPVSLTGDICQVNHLNVSCDAGGMTICYLPHPGVNMSSPRPSVTINSMGLRRECQMLPADAACGHGWYRLRTPWADTDPPNSCATKRIVAQYETIRYENMMAVYKSDVDVIFMKTYCVIQTHMKQSFGAAHIGMGSAAEEGQTLRPVLTFDMLDVTGESLQLGAMLLPGDKVTFRITVDQTSGYRSLKVDYCVMASSPTLGNQQEEYIPVTIGGCPTSGQSFINLANTWRKSPGAPSVVRTGTVALRRLRTGDSVYLHCSVRVCMEYFIEECVQPSCSAEGMSRRRRDVDRPAHNVTSITVTQEIRFPQNTSLSGGELFYRRLSVQPDTMIVVICVIILAAIIILIATAIVCLRQLRTAPNTNIKPDRLAWIVRDSAAQGPQFDGGHSQGNVSHVDLNTSKV